MKCISFVEVLVIVLLLAGAAMAAKDVEIVLEAELADEIQAPLVIATPDDVKEVGGGVPNEPSNGKLVWAPGPPATGGGGAGFMTFIIDIPEADMYAIWGNVVAWDGNSDSFWVTWEPADPAENPQQTQNTEFRWGVAQGPNWHWDRINHWLNAGTFDREWEFDKGETILKIWSREDATMLDSLYITNDIDGGQANARVPDDDDRKLQEQGGGGQAVDAADKLSITWGSVKSLY